MAGHAWGSNWAGEVSFRPGEASSSPAVDSEPWARPGDVRKTNFTLQQNSFKNAVARLRSDCLAGKALGLKLAKGG